MRKWARESNDCLTLMIIRWSPEAVEDLERVVRHIQSDNLTAARKVAHTIYNGVTNLKNFPSCGLAKGGEVFVAGVTDSNQWPNL
jgi:plasmid stabilization system protein ParE